MRGEAARQTVGYFGGHVALGLMSAVLGPTLPALAAQVSCDPESLGILFAARSFGYLLASLIFGRVYDRRAGHPIMVAALIGIAVGLAVVPLMPSRLALIALLLALGLGQGALDVGNNVMLARVHGVRVAPYMTALHCFYGLGALLAPLVVGASSSVAWGYWWLALAMLPAGALIGSNRSPKPLDSTDHGESVRGKPDTGLVWLLVGWFVLCQAAEAGFAGWIFTVATETGIDEADASKLLSSFWAAFTVARVLSIAAAARVRPQTLLTLDLLGALASMTAMVLIPGEAALWIATLTFGMSLASVFPATLSLAGERMPLDGAVTSKFFVGASLGAMLLPWVLGHALVFGPRGPLWLILADLGGAGVVLVGIRARLRSD